MKNVTLIVPLEIIEVALREIGYLKPFDIVVDWEIEDDDHIKLFLDTGKNLEDLK